MLTRYFNILHMEELSYWTEHCKIQEATVGWGGGDERCVQNIGEETSRKTSVLGFGISDIEPLNSAATILDSGTKCPFLLCRRARLLYRVESLDQSIHSVPGAMLWVKGHYELIRVPENLVIICRYCPQWLITVLHCRHQDRGTCNSPGCCTAYSQI
jgi:hypothetical protein